jgi:hypothetical protein
MGGGGNGKCKTQPLAWCTCDPGERRGEEEGGGGWVERVQADVV